MVAILSALIPTLLYVTIIYWADQYEKEPVWLLSAVFIWGAIPSVLLALLFNALIGDGVTNTLLIPAVEETAKAAGIAILFLLRREEIDAPLDGIVYGAMVGMGFSTVENGLYYQNALADGTFTLTFLQRGILFGLLHALYSGLVGFGFAIRRLNRIPIVGLLVVIVTWATAVALHTLHNVITTMGDQFIVLAIVMDGFALLMMLLIVAIALFQERRWIRRHLNDEVELLRPHQRHIAISRRRRNVYLLRILFRHGWRRFQHTRRYYHAVSRLAYRKQYLHRHPEYEAEIAALRDEIRRLNVEKTAI